MGASAYNAANYTVEVAVGQARQAQERDDIQANCVHDELQLGDQYDDLERQRQADVPQGRPDHYQRHVSRRSREQPGALLNSGADATFTVSAKAKQIVVS